MTGDIMSYTHKDIYYLETKAKTQVSFIVIVVAGGSADASSARAFQPLQLELS